MICIETVKRYCTDYTKIENYELAQSDTTQMWECHHRNESHYTRNELKDLGLYYDCPHCELIFVTKEEHYKQPHNGEVCIRAYECPPGFKPGMLRKGGK